MIAIIWFYMVQTKLMQYGHHEKCYEIEWLIEASRFESILSLEMSLN